MFQTKVAEKIKIHILCSVTFFFENLAAYEKIAEPNRPQTTTRRMRGARRIPKATNIHSEYIIHTAFQLQQWLHECASMLRYAYIACLVRVRLVL